MIGCKDTNQANVCIEEDLGTGECLEYGSIQYSECGVIDTIDAGKCAQDSDCGIIGTYYCDWNSQTNKGTCKPFEPHECTYNYDCSQTGSGCFNRKLTSVNCVDGMCVDESRDVGCCNLADCPSGYYCTADYVCKLSQVEPADCTYECCDQAYNPADSQYKQKTCPPQEPVCCSDHVCAATIDDCSGGNGVSCVIEGNFCYLGFPCCEGLICEGSFLGLTPGTCKKESGDFDWTSLMWIFIIIAILVTIIVVVLAFKKRKG